MTGEPRSVVKALCGTEAHERIAAERKRHREDCAVFAAKCYFEIVRRLDGDVASAAGLFEAIARASRETLVPKRRGGRAAAPNIDAGILAVGDMAEDGKKRAAVAQLLGATTGKATSAAWKRYQRLRAERAAFEKKGRELAAAVLEAYRAGDLAAARAALLAGLAK